MSEMLLRVARAICKSIDKRNPDHLIAVYENRPCEGGGIMLPIYKHDWENYLTQARTAMEAMREPTEEMLNAANTMGIDQDPRDYWTAMIEGALK